MLWLAIVYACVGACVAVLAVFTAQRLKLTYAELAAEAVRQGRPVPPLVRAYFRGTSRTLWVTGVAFAVFTGADAAAATMGGVRGAWIAGLMGALFLLVCGFALVFQAFADRSLQLHPEKLRNLQLVAGVLGILAAGAALYLVLQDGGVFTHYAVDLELA
jgi:hypothetical protein